MHALPLLLILTAAPAYPKDASPASCEDPSHSPMDVCNAMADAAKRGDTDALVAHCTAAVRQKFNNEAKLALKGMHNVLTGVRCVRVDQQDDKQAVLYVYAPEKQSRQVPLVKENGYWRFDYEVYKQLGKAPADKQAKK